MSDTQLIEMLQQFFNDMKDMCDDFISKLNPLELGTKSSRSEEEVSQKPKKSKKAKDPLAPKMPRSAFIIYFQEKKEKFMQKY